MSTPKEDYLKVIKNTHLIALDLIIINEKNQVLLGYRNNNPAKNTWFTFGSRIFKEESFEKVCERISSTELGLDIKLIECSKNGVYSHNYPNNFENDDFGTNYIVFAFIYKCLSKDIGNLDNLKGDNQHTIFNWFDVDDVIKRNNEYNIHENVRYYFIENPPNRVF